MRNGQHLRNLWNLLLERFGEVCSFCGSWKRPEFAHVKKTKLNGRGRGKKTRYQDINKNPESYILLCHTCHGKMDRGIITLETS